MESKEKLWQRKSLLDLMRQKSRDSEDELLDDPDEEAENEENILPRGL